MALRPSPVHFLQGPPTLPSSWPRDWEQSTPFVTRRVLLLLRLFSINSAQIVIDSLLQNEIWKIRTPEAISLAELMISQLTRKESSLAGYMAMVNERWWWLWRCWWVLCVAKCKVLTCEFANTSITRVVFVNLLKFLCRLPGTQVKYHTVRRFKLRS